MTSRRRNGLILLLVIGLLIGSVVVILSQPTRLGLDLKGGVQLVYQGKPTPQQPQVTPEALDRAIDIMRERVDELGVAEPQIQTLGEDQIEVGLPDVQNADRAIDQVGQVAQLYLYDWEANVIGPDGKPDPSNPEVTGGQAAGSAGTLPTLYDAVKRASKRPPVKNERDGKVVNTSGPQFYLFDKDSKRLIAGPEENTRDLLESSKGRQPPGSEILKVSTGTIVVQGEKPPGQPDAFSPGYYVLNDNPSLTGTDITDPKQTFSNGTSGPPVVSFSFTDRGQQAFQDVTRTLAQRGVEQQIPGAGSEAAFQHFAVILDNEVVSAPFIDYQQNPDGIGGETGAQIEGGFTVQSAQDLAKILQIGALPIKLELISQSQVSASLGQQALNDGLTAGIAGFLIVVLFLLLFYRLLGVVAAIALVIYAVYFFALIKLIPIVLTLPGIAGLILTIGVAADANIVVFERIKEEVRAGRSIPAAITTGYKKGLSAIIDANVVTLLTAFILFILATSGVQGFAFTLGVGVLVSLFTAVLATSAILGLASTTKLIARPSLLGAGERRFKFRFDFMGASKWFFSMSGVILLIGALAIGGKGLEFGIDFESGTRIDVAVQGNTDENGIRSVLEASGAQDAEVQRLSGSELGPNAFQVSTNELAPAEVGRVQQTLDRRFQVTSFSNQSVGPTFGQTVASTALIAIIASLAVISLWIALRFEWKYAVPVLIAVFHDILITAGVYSLTDREVTTATVAALLTVLGYSLYDTIIVFDRIRENVPRMPRATYGQIANRSMSEVLGRSLATSFCTALPILALLLFGGETLQDFAFALFVGTISGAYSSIFIATPVLMHWKEREPVYVRRARRLIREHGFVPPYAEAVDGPVDVEPERKTSRLRRKGRLSDPEPDQVSGEEFDDLVRDLDVDEAEAAKPQPKPKPKRPKPKRDAAPVSLGKDGEGDGDGDGDGAPPAPRPASRPAGRSGSSSTSRSSSTSTARRRAPARPAADPPQGDGADGGGNGQAAKGDGGEPAGTGPARPKRQRPSGGGQGQRKSRRRHGRNR